MQNSLMIFQTLPFSSRQIAPSSIWNFNTYPFGRDVLMHYSSHLVVLIHLLLTGLHLTSCFICWVVLVAFLHTFLLGSCLARWIPPSVALVSMFCCWSVMIGAFVVFSATLSVHRWVQAEHGFFLLLPWFIFFFSLSSSLEWCCWRCSLSRSSLGDVTDVLLDLCCLSWLMALAFISPSFHLMYSCRVSAYAEMRHEWLPFHPLVRLLYCMYYL